MRLGLQCLANRLFESYRFQRIASSSIARSERYNGRQKRAGTVRNNGNMKTDHVHAYTPEKKIFFHHDHTKKCIFVRFFDSCHLSNMRLVCAAKISTSKRVYLVRYRITRDI